MAALLALLLCEGLLFGLVFDSDTLPLLPVGWWTHLFPVFPLLLRISAIIAAAGLLLGGARLSQALAAESEAIAAHRVAPGLAAHLLCVAALFVISGQIFGVIAKQSPHPGGWILAWFAVSAACVLSWLWAALPWHVLALLTKQLGGLLALGAVVGVGAWALGQYTMTWWTPLRSLTLHAAYALLRIVDRTSFLNASHYLIGAHRFAVEIDARCSGYEGIGLCWIFVAAYWWFFRSHLRFPQVLLLLPLVTFASWLGNVARITVLVLIGAHGLPHIALGSFHSYAGLLLFLAIALATAFVSERTPFFSRSAVASDREHWNPASPWLLPFLTALAVALVTESLHRPGFDPLYALRVIAAGGVLLCYQKTYRNFAFGFSWTWLLIGVVVAALWTLLSWRTPAPALPFPAGSRAAVQWLVFRSIGYVLIIPAIEELAFRGFLARKLTSNDFEAVRFEDLSWAAILLSSLLFGMMHSQFVAGTLAGIGYAWAVRFRGRITDGIAAHCTTNALLTALALTTHHWGIWG